MKTLYHQKSGKSFIFLILKKRHYISSVIFLYISTLQAGKHRLFLNILLFGKLQTPTLIQLVWTRLIARQAAPVKELFSFGVRIVFLKVPCSPPFTQSIPHQPVEYYTSWYAITQPTVATAYCHGFTSNRAITAPINSD